MSAHKYELMFIADPELDERGLKKLTEQYLELVTKEGGSFDEPDYWGRRKLAYEIAGKTEGNYVVVKYTAEPATSDELDRVLNLNGHHHRGQPHCGPRAAHYWQRCDRGELHDCFHPANLESSDQPVRGWSGAVHEVLRLA